MILIKATSIVDEAQSQFKYISVHYSFISVVPSCYGIGRKSIITWFYLLEKSAVITLVFQ